MTRLACSVPFAVLLVATVSAADRPNFLFIYTDDQQWDTLGVVQREQGERARFPWLESPNLDRLAAEGIRFRNAFVVTSLCAPSRAAFLTGRYGHDNGIVDNHTPLAENSVTWASQLRAAGYRTGYVGKWHMGSQSGQRPGFDYSASFIGQGKYFDCPVEINGTSTPTEGWVDDVSTEFAIEFLKQNRQRPFALALGYKTCHGPFEPPERHAGDYGEAEARPTPNTSVRAIYQDDPTTIKPAKQKRAVAQAAAGGRKTNLGYFRGLRAIDENVGKLLAKLAELGLADNTVVIYSSDNGYYLGEHSLGDKRTAYDESLRIPMLVRWPKLAARGTTINEMVLNIDLAPTLLDLAGVPIPRQMQGRSWRPLLAGDPAKANWRHAFFYEYFREGRFGAPTVTAVRTDHAKLIKYPGHPEWTEMFDLDADPYEIQNLYNQPAQAALQSELERQYNDEAKAVGYHVPDFADEKRLPPAPKPLDAWVLDYAFDGAAKRAHDKSGSKNDGQVSGIQSVTLDDRQAWKFDGNGHVDVPRSASLDPSVGPWYVEATLRADGPEGVVLAQGGASQGYALFIEKGKPGFVYRIANTRAPKVIGSESIAGRWVTVAAEATADHRLVLKVDGKAVAERQLADFIGATPHDGLDIGIDASSKVLDPPLPGFRGLIERVRIYSGNPSSAITASGPSGTKKGGAPSKR